jgi:hypothetical protein
VLTWKTVDPKAIYPLERYHAVSGNHEYRIFYGLKAASQDRPWVLVIREVGMACTPAEAFNDHLQSLQQAGVATTN